MGIKDVEVKPATKLLTGFTGKTSMTMGNIKLSVDVGRIMKLVKFSVLDKPAIYNIILGTLWIYGMRAVAYTYHQCVKFLTQDGTHTIRGNQRMFRTCFVSEKKLGMKSTLHVREQDERHAKSLASASPKHDFVTKICLNDGNPTRFIDIRAELTEEIKVELVEFLRQNIQHSPGRSMTWKE